MKVLTSPASHGQRTVRRVSKPVMEKRRRERINHSLETLRLLMLDHTHNEKLKNPKVEKAEILESVVHFLKTEKDVEKGHHTVKRVLSREQRPTCARQHNYQEGMTSCLLRISHFIASKSQDPEEGGGHASLPEPQTRPSSPGLIHHRALIPAGDSTALSPQHLPQHQRQRGVSHPYLTQRTELCDTRTLLSSTAACTNITDPVWRPWPQ
ncbi:hairy-related 5 [Thunnus albacares]|uniref:hairy-related 5 n=1 Tax=Thunnus albacares TaxID=8236 RepID=UPI001CF6B8BF|nr:hairy-related 5 [Thunnus albacares]